MNLYRTGFQTCILAKKHCALARQKLLIRLEKWGEISGTRFARPTFWLLKNRLVRLWCVYCIKSEPIFKIVISRVLRALRATTRGVVLLQSRSSENARHLNGSNGKKWAVQKKWTRFCETILREGGFAKPRLMFLKFSGIWVSAPQEGAGGMRGGFFRFSEFRQ